MVQGEGALAEIGPLAVALGGEGARVLLSADPGLKPSGMVDEALAAKELGEERVILFNYSGHGFLDLAAYDDYRHGRLIDA